MSNIIWQHLSAEVAYLRPIKSRKNLSIITNSLVQKLILDGKKCVGVEVKNRGKLKKINCSKEVILCGGAINSPQILELSGIGDPEILNKFSIGVKHELPGVGRNLRDHYSPRMRFTITEKGATFNDNARGWRLAAEAIKYATTGKGFFAMCSCPPMVPMCRMTQ